MDFSDTSNLTGLVEDIDFLCNTDSTSYPLKDKARNINRWLYKAVTDMLKADGRFQFDDSNLTDLPIATTTMVAAQQDYSLPSGLLRVRAVEVKNSDGDWVRLQELDKQELLGTITDHEETDGMPHSYDISGDSIYLYPAPTAADTTLSSGLKIHFAREIDIFASTDTTQEPGIPEPFHRICSYGASYDYLIVNDTTEKANAIRQEVEQLRAELREFANDRNDDATPAFRPKVSTIDFI